MVGPCRFLSRVTGRSLPALRHPPSSSPLVPMSSTSRRPVFPFGPRRPSLLRRLPPALAALAASAATSYAQGAAPAASPVETPLAKPNASIEGLESLRGLRELGTGRLLVVNGAQLELVDLSTRKREERALTANGPAPRALQGLWRWVDDSLVTIDPLSGRFFIVDGSGNVVREQRVRLPSGPMRGPAGSGGPGGPGGPGGAQGGGITGIRALVSPELALGTGQPPRPQLTGAAAATQAPPRIPIPIVRIRLASATFDTAAQLMPAQAPKPPVMGSGGNYKVYANTSALQPVDTWAPLSDGTVMILRAASYRVDLIGVDGTRVSLGPVPFTPVPVTDDDRKRVMDDNRRTVEEALRNNPRRTSISTIAVEEPSSWPSTHPPFRGDLAPVVDPIDRVWVVTRCEKEAKARCYDVIDRDGQRQGRVRLPDRTLVVGFGAVSIYTLDVQKPDKPVLQRHPLPF